MHPLFESTKMTFREPALEFQWPDFYYDLSKADRDAATIESLYVTDDEEEDEKVQYCILKAGGRIAWFGFFIADGYGIGAWVEVESLEIDDEWRVCGRLANQLPCEEGTLGLTVEIEESGFPNVPDMITIGKGTDQQDLKVKIKKPA